MKLNTKLDPIKTHEGGIAHAINAKLQLRRSVMACFLWEKSYYENGEDLANTIVFLSEKVERRFLIDLAIEAREQHNLRHVSLLLMACVCKLKSGSSEISEAIARVISRADELSEFVAILAKINDVKPSEIKGKLSAQAKKGLAKAFIKFDSYQLAKYNRDGAIKLRDVLFLSHAKPKDDEQALAWGKLIDGTLEPPDTWEVSLSRGADKKETFERLILQKKLGYMALLRNLRNIHEANVDRDMVKDAILNGNSSRVLPFRFVAAAQHAPSFEPFLDVAMIKNINKLPLLCGKTVFLVDISASMYDSVSQKSDISRMTAAATLASMTNCDEKRVFSFSHETIEVPPRAGMAGIEVILESQYHGGTYMAGAIRSINSAINYDRIIVITDEQSHDGCEKPLQGSKAYMINVATNKNGVGYGEWTHIDGFSENVLKYIYEIESIERE